MSERWADERRAAARIRPSSALRACAAAAHDNRATRRVRSDALDRTLSSASSRVRTALASAPLARVRCELAHGICVCMRRVHVCSRFCVCSAVQSQSIHRPYLVQSACNGIDLARSHFITFRIVSHYIRSRQLAVSTGGADYIRCNWRALHTLQWAFFRCNALHRLALCNIVCYIRCSVAEPAHFGFQ